MFRLELSARRYERGYVRSFKGRCTAKGMLMFDFIQKNGQRMRAALDAVRGIALLTFSPNHRKKDLSYRNAWISTFKIELVDALGGLYVELFLPFIAMSLLIFFIYGVLNNTYFGRGFWPFYVVFVVAWIGKIIHVLWSQLCTMTRPGEVYAPLNLMYISPRRVWASLYKRAEFLLYTMAIILLPCWAAWLIIFYSIGFLGLHRT